MILTITCESILSEDLNEFKSQISQYSYMGGLDEDENDIMFKLTHDIMLKKYGLSQVRYETETNFLNALSLRFYNIAPIYFKKISLINSLLSIENNKLLLNGKDFTENKTNSIESEQTENRRSAETPTTIKATTEFIDRYTNEASKANTEGTSEESGTLEHIETDASAVLKKIDELQNLKTKYLEEYAQAYSDLFIQFI